MKYWILLMYVIGALTLHAYEVPTSIKAEEGKTVYVPVAQPVNIKEEIRIQQEDQNISRQGGRQ